MPDDKRRVEETIRDAIQDVQSPEAAEAVVEDLEQIAAGVTEHDAAQQAESVPLAPAEVVERSAETSAGPQRPAAAIAAAAAEAVASTKQADQTLEAAQEVFQPAVGEHPPAAAAVRPRGYLQSAVLRRMSPLQALDAQLFIAVNNLPRNSVTNSAMYAITFVTTGGVAWQVATLLVWLRGSRTARRALRELVPSVTIATVLVEYPIKAFFRRRRPFIEVVRALVIGKKPGSWSFPSGHTCSSFAAARALSAIWPQHSALYYAAAGIVGFSRIYLGAHYPGDVLSGAFAGTVLGDLAQRGVRRLLSRRSARPPSM